MNGYLSGESKPAWYELSLKGTNIISISIHREAFDALMQIKWASMPGVTHLQKTLNLPSFVLPGERSWGFSETLRLSASDRPEWMVWDCHLPILKLKAEKTSVLPLRSSLNLLMNALWLFKGNTGWKDRQLMVIESIVLPTDPDMHQNNGSLSVTLAPDVMMWISEWISVHGDGMHIPEVVEAMKAAMEHMWDGNSCRGRFGALCRKPKWLNLDVPGDACGLDPGSYDNLSLERGYTLHPHNVDSSLQQLAFLAGLARLHDFIRADKSKK